MSGIQSIGGPDVRAAIARAAQRTGVDFNYLMAQARIESGLDPKAKAGTSSAAGLYQFTNGTWLQTLDRHASEHGLDWAGSAIEGGRVRDPGMRAQIMALRYDPDASATMAAELASDNGAGLEAQLGRTPDPAELYLAHFLGLGGASQFLRALDENPGQSAAALMPKPAAANRAIFFGSNGSPRSVAEVMEVLRGKVARAMGDMPLPDASPGAQPDSDWDAARLAFQSPAAALSAAAANSSPALSPSASPPVARPSMAETLRDTFGLASSDSHASTPAFVRAAYGTLRSFGL